MHAEQNGSWIPNFRFGRSDGMTLAYPQKSEFVEKDREIKSLLFRQFIYVNLGILVELCKNLPFTCKTHKSRRKTQNSFVPYLTSA